MSRIRAFKFDEDTIRNVAAAVAQVEEKAKGAEPIGAISFVERVWSHIMDLRKRGYVQGIDIARILVYGRPVKRHEPRPQKLVDLDEKTVARAILARFRKRRLIRGTRRKRSNPRLPPRPSSQSQGVESAGSESLASRPAAAPSTPPRVTPARVPVPASAPNRISTADKYSVGPQRTHARRKP